MRYQAGQIRKDVAHATLYGIAAPTVGLAAWLLDHNDADDQKEAKKGGAS